MDQILVHVGQNVEAGTPLVKLQNQPSESNLQIARNQLELARRNARPDSDLLSQLSRQVESMSSVFQRDSVDFERYRNLLQDSIISVQAFDRASLLYQTSYYNYQISQSKLRETRDRLQTELQNAISYYAAQESMAGDYALLSAIEGRVYDILTKEGELIAGNRPIMMIGSTNRFETELQVDETDIMFIQEGQQVFYELDALANTVLTGVITRIYPRVNPVDRTAKVIASINPLEYRLYPGMALEANIVIREKADVLVLPVTFVSESNEVLLKDRTSRSVVTGIRDLNYVEIVSGLEEGDIILKPES